MTRIINFRDQSWSYQPPLPLGPSGNQIPANEANAAQFMMAPASQTQFAYNPSSNAINGFGNQALAQQPVYPGNLPVQSAYPSARLIGAFTNNTLREGLQQRVPVQGPHLGFAQPQGVSVNSTQNFNRQNFMNIPLDSNSRYAFIIQQNPNGNPGTPAFQNISSDCEELDLSHKTLSRTTIKQILADYNARSESAEGQGASENISQDFSIPSSLDMLQRSNSEDFMDISQSSNSHSETPPFQSVSSDHGQLNPLQVTGSQNAVQQPMSNYFAHSGSAQGQGLLQDIQHNPNSQDSMPERPRPPRDNQGQVEAPGIRYCVRCRSKLAYCAVWCSSCKQDISNGLPGPRHCMFCRKPASGPKSIVCPGHLRRGIGLSGEGKRVLEGEGMCKRCYKAEACPGILKCERCRADQKRYGATSRDTRAHRGICLNCTNIVEGTEFRNCATCRQKKAEGTKETRRRKNDQDHSGTDHGGTE